jgi:insecticidal toxin complex protein TccC
MQVISVQAGRSSVRVLRWESAPPKDMGKDQYRYHLNDHLGSCTLELDDDGEVISQERYHPYGTTAWFAGRGVEASYRTVRYSGKERDATGLYYYGFRYYVSWWQRWVNPDPAGNVDGLNIYSMVRNNPINLKDADGRQSDFNRFFKPEQGDLIFGMYKIVENRYLSWYAKLTDRGDVLAMHFTRKDTEELIGGLHKIRGDYTKAEFYMKLTDPEGTEWLRHTLSVINEDQHALVASRISKGHGFWLENYVKAKGKVAEVENKFYEKIKSSHATFFSRKVYRGFSERFAAELAGGKYSVSSTFQRYVDDENGELRFDLNSRASKAGLLTMLKSEDSAVVHFMLDGLDMNSVVSKSQQSITSSELRYLYRNREKLADKVLFYQEGKLVDAPWRTDRIGWSRYKPRSASVGV